jgi:hypothetical protein
MREEPNPIAKPAQPARRMPVPADEPIIRDNVGADLAELASGLLPPSAGVASATWESWAVVSSAGVCEPGAAGWPREIAARHRGTRLNANETPLWVASPVETDEAR